MVDDIDWFWSSEYGRDKMLREEVEGLQSVAARANASSARLSSQLTRLQGSLEKRLSALSIAFDAYVELGDVREQLATFPDTGGIRRECASAIEALAAGRPAERIDPRGLGYWLPQAMNAVIATVGGRADPAAEQSARDLSRDAELFMVMALGALGHGAEVASRVPDLLIGDGVLNERQQVLWQAAIDGVYGTAVLPEIGALWGATLAEAGPEDWAEWVSVTGQRDTPSDGLRWLEEQLNLAEQERLLSDLSSSASTPETTDGADVRRALRGIVSQLVGEGMDNERELLERARVLRSRVESPTAAPPPEEETENPSGVSTVAAVRSAYVEVTDPAVRALLLEWMRPSLHGVIQHFAGEAAREQAPPTTSVRTPGGRTEVSVAGVDPAERARLVDNIAEFSAYRPTGLIVAAAAAVVSLVFALIVGIGTSQTVLAVMLAVVAVVCGGFAVKAVLDRRRAQQQRMANLERLDRQISEAQVQVVAQVRQRDQSAVEAQQLVGRLRERYATPVQTPVVDLAKSAEPA